MKKKTIINLFLRLKNLQCNFITYFVKCFELLTKIRTDLFILFSLLLLLRYYFSSFFHVSLV